MLPTLKRVVLSCAIVCSLSASAQSGGMAIAGGVYEDRLVLAVRPHFIGAEGVTVKLHRDDGDHVPSAGDVPLGTTKTSRGGMYVFRVHRAGDYWVSVDSRSFHADAWPEQTFGPPGSLCAHPDGTTRTTWYEGACFGGRTTRGADNASSLLTSEHLALVKLRDQLTSVDFAFSYDAVISTADGDSMQGTLRQYFLNANAVRGPNRMRFVPLERAAEQRETNYGVAPRWWTIALASPLPEVTDDDTIVDGTAYNFLSPASATDVHPGRFGEPPTLVSGERQVSRLRKPELEIVAGGAAGIVCNATCGLRGFALHGSSSGIIARADTRIEHVLVGAAPDGVPATGGVIGLQIERGTTVARHLLVTSQTRTGISVTREARLDGERLDVSRSGQPLTGAGIVLLSNGSSVRSSTISANPGAGIVLGSTDGTTPAIGNSLDGNTISGNQAGVILSPGSSRNAITRNDIMWNRVGGVTIVPFENAPPRENRISANRFDENGLRPIILDLQTPDPNVLHPGADTCEGVTAAANRGIPAPRVTSVRVSDEGGGMRAIIRGRACPGQIIEIYQSYVTSGVRDMKSPVMPNVRDDAIELETLTAERRTFSLPSIGEFNYLGATNTKPDGTFEAMFPIPVFTPAGPSVLDDEETDIWATQVLTASAPEDRAFSAIAIDAAGNTSEMSVRRKTD
ncbi:MAG: right-handed parallel beta-helix repeat-containing protein [Thermoanaerobaculia bacterium]